MNAPCMGCKDRCVQPVNCHTFCEKYRVYDEERKMIRQEKADARMIEDAKTIAVEYTNKPWNKVKMMDCVYAQYRERRKNR